MEVMTKLVFNYLTPFKNELYSEQVRTWAPETYTTAKTPDTIAFIALQ